MGRIVSASEAAKLRGVCGETVRRWARESWLSSARKSGRVWLVDLDEVMRFESPQLGWPASVKRCPICTGALVEGHKCKVRDEVPDLDDPNFASF